jgi:hypothetical protein
LRRRWREHAAGSDIKTVPRAGHFYPHKQSLREGPASVGTGFVNRIERPVDVEERYFLPGGIYEFAFTRSDLRRLW